MLCRRLIPAIRLLLSIIRQPTPHRALHPLVIVRTILSTHAPSRGPVAVALDALAAPGAAARGEEPEEAAGEGERDADPDDDVDLVAERALDVVFLEGGVEGAGESGVEDGACEGEADVEERADAADDGGGQAAPAREEGEEADEDLDDRGDEGDDVGDEHPFGDCAVGVQAVGQLFAEELVDAGVVEAPYVHRVEPELVLVRRAECDLVTDTPCAVCAEISRAIVPETDVVEVLDIECGFGGGSSVVEDLVGQRV